MSVQVYGVSSDSMTAQVIVYGVTSEVPAPPPIGEYVWSGGTWVTAPAYMYDGSDWTLVSMADA